MYKVIKIMPNENAEIVELTDKVVGLQTMYDILGVDIIDIVRCRKIAGLTNLELIVDDEALLKPSPVLNYVASVLAGRLIYGPAMICSMEDTIEGVRSIGLLPIHANAVKSTLDIFV